MTAIGDVSMTYTVATVNRVTGHPFWPLEGHTVDFIDQTDTWKTSSKTVLGVNFNLTATLTPIAKPSVTGTASLSLESTAKDRVDHVLHRKYRNIVDPLQVYEVWEYGGMLHIYQFRLTADAVNGLKIEQDEKNGSYYEQVFSGSPPAPAVMVGPEIPPFSKVLDAVQFGLDIAGMVPVIGEAADAVNAGIHLGRGNFAEAGMSVAGMIPFAGIAATLGKFGKKAVGAVAHNAGNIEKVADGLGDICKKSNCFVAGTPVVVAAVQVREKSQPASETELPTPTESDGDLSEVFEDAPTPPMVMESASENHSFSVVFVGAGLALAVIRHTWTSSPPPQRPRRSRRMPKPLSGS